jgi:hypothetical protein
VSLSLVLPLSLCVSCSTYGRWKICPATCDSHTKQAMQVAAVAGDMQYGASVMMYRAPGVRRRRGRVGVCGTRKWAEGVAVGPGEPVGRKRG